MILIIAALILGICFALLIWHNLTLINRKIDVKFMETDVLQLAKFMFPEIDNPVVALDELEKYIHRLMVALHRSDAQWNLYYKIYELICDERHRQITASVIHEFKCQKLLQPDGQN